MSEPLGWPYEVPRRRGTLRDQLSTGSPLPPSAPATCGDRRDVHAQEHADRRNVLYPVEESRGYQARGDLWSQASSPLTLAGARSAPIASTEPFETVSVLTAAGTARRGARPTPAAARAGGVRRREGVAAELVLAADQFIITPAGRTEEAARARASGDEVRTVIAGYHWFTDWGRDTMISLEGLTLATGRQRRGRATSCGRSRTTCATA